MSPSEKISGWYNKLGKPIKICFFSTLIIGIFAHLFAMTNFLFNYDSIACIPYGLGGTLKSGRWFLWILEDLQNRLWQPYCIPAFNAFLSIVYIAAAACFVVSFLEIREPLHCVLLGGIMVSFPTVTSTMAFIFTAPHYTLAIALTALAAYFADKGKRGVVLSVLALALSLGIYQANLPFTAALMVIQLVRLLLIGRLNWKAAAKKGFRYLAILAGGTLLYYLIMKLLVNLTGMQITDYQGLSSMGVISLHELRQAIVKIYETFILLPFRSYHTFNITPIIRFSLLLLGTASLLLLLVCRKHSAFSCAAAIFLSFLFPIAAAGIEIMCGHSDIYVLMIYAMSSCFIFPVVLDEAVREADGAAIQFPKLKNAVSWIIAAALAVSVLNYCWSSNGNYTFLMHADKQTENYLNSVVTVMRSTDGYDEDLPVAFIGNIDDPYFDSRRISTHFTYEGFFNSNDPRQNINSYSRIDMLRILLGYVYMPASQEQMETIKQSEDFKTMPCYPNCGSMKVIDGVFTVKFSE